MPRMSGALPRGVVLLVGLAAATVASIGLSSIRAILAPVLLTLILTICAHPVRLYAQKRGVPQGLATGSVIVVMFALLAGFTLTVIVAVGQFIAMLPQYAGQFEQIGQNIHAWLGSLGISQDQASALVSTIDPRNIMALLTGAVGGVFSISGALVIVLTMMILMSADAVYIPTILHQLAIREPHLVTALTDYASNVRRYMVVTTVLGLAQGAINALSLWILHVPAALLWGLLAFLCSFIPNVGYFFAIVPPMVFGFLVGGWPTLIAVVIIYGLVNAVVQSIIQPRVVGQAVSLSQSITFFSVLFWAVVIGPIGAILAIPLTLLGKALLIDSNPEARFWRPALGPTGETRNIKQLDDLESKRTRRVAHRASKDAAAEPTEPTEEHPA
ncbi:AI-2E family transporter [Arthrobacter sp. GMC3]|uniref:AI-2E family transporter n=1 Tax=Arthrobacter sp. GMC3 TaxID=2058894 RepID=UPI001C668B4C|nr:AI-2E family transporter [Arthrobacter sp. GMC3]